MQPSEEHDGADGELTETSREDTSADYQAFDDMLEGVAIIGSDWRYRYRNDASLRLSGVTWEQTIGRSMFEVNPGIERTDLYESYRKVIETGLPYDRELPYRRPDGTVLWLEVRIRPHPVGLFVLGIDRTGPHLADQALAAAEDRYRLMAENASDVVAHSSADGICDWVSPSIEGLLGLESSRVVGQPFSRLLHPEDAERMRDALLRNGTVLMEGRARSKGDTWHWVEARARIVLDEDGRRTGIVGSLRDIQAERETREALKESERNHRLLAENASDLVFRTDPAGLLEYISPSAREILGYEPAELIGLDSTSIVLPADRATVVASRRNVNAHGRGAFRLRLVRKDGSVRWMELTARSITEDGVVVGRVAGARDVQAEVTAERALQTARDELAQAQRLAAVTSWTMDLQTGIAVRSDELDRFLRGTGAEDSQQGADAPSAFEHETVRAWCRTAPHRGDALSVELDLEGADGEQRRVVTRGEVIRNQDGAVVGLRVTQADITDLHRARLALAAANATLEEQVERRTAELREANEELTSFTYTVSHDLRSPIRAIAGFARLLERGSGAKLDEVGRHRLENIADSAETMGRLIDDLLRFTRVGRGAVAHEAVAIGPIVGRLRETHAERLEELGGRIELQGEVATPTTDPTLLEQVLLNLVNNAVAYHRPGVPPVIVIRADRVGERIRVSVQDNGRGIAPDQVDRIFEVFTRATQEQDLAHAGIGLATVRRRLARWAARSWCRASWGSARRSG